MPDDLLRVDCLAVHDGGDFPIGAAGVKADAAAVCMTADPSGLFAGSGEMRLVRDYNFKGALIDVLHKADVEFPLPTRAVFVLHTLCDRVVAAEGNFPAADAPEKHLDKALDKAHIRLGEFRAAQLRLKHGNKAVFALHGDFERAGSFFQVGLCPHAERNDVRIERGQVFDRIFNAQILHSVPHCGILAAAASSQISVTSWWNCKIEPGTSGVTGPKKTL